MTHAKKSITGAPPISTMVGVPRIKFKGKKGQEITIHYCEMLYPEVIPTEPVAPYTIELYQ